jgi:hypothetical protein
VSSLKSEFLLKFFKILFYFTGVEEYDIIEIYVGLIERPPGFYVWTTTIRDKSNFFVHPQRNTSDISNDVALVRMDAAPDDLLSSPYVAVVPLPRSDQMNVDLTEKIATVIKIMSFVKKKN